VVQSLAGYPNSPDKTTIQWAPEKLSSIERGMKKMHLFLHPSSTYAFVACTGITSTFYVLKYLNGIEQHAVMLKVRV
jgi:uncharacterized membrane protein